MTWLKGKAGPELKKRAREQRRPLLKTVVSSAQVVMMLASEQYEYQNPFTSKGLVADEGAAGIAWQTDQQRIIRPALNAL